VDTVVKVTVIAGAKLTPELVSRWRQIQEANPELASPYFCPEFTLAVAAVRRDVHVGIMENGTGIVGFFPFQRGRRGIGKPVGGALSDYHGVIATQDTHWDAIDLLRGCGLGSYEFGHLLASQTPFKPYHFGKADSHYVDLSQGFDDYACRLRESGSHLLKDVDYQRRRLEREHGTVRFVPHTTDAGVLRAVLDWKSDQYRRSGLVDVFDFDWTTALLERIHATQTDRFAGVLSALYVGDVLAAAHMGMRSSSVWHWWFPAHSAEFQRYSPGMILLTAFLRYAGQSDARILDLGKGDAFYKDRLRGGAVALAEGRVELPSLNTVLRQLRRDTEAWVRRSPLAPIARIPGRLITRMERRQRFR
jgi:CelD/BcsL family acetyltransferase involved in cellulose biosynthesis